MNCSLREGSKDYLDYDIEKQPYALRKMSMGINLEELVYYLLDFQVTRSLWDPYFLYAETIERMDQNNAILRIVYKPVEILSSPCTIYSSLRDYCVYMHYNYEKEDHCYYILFVSTHHRHCSSKKGLIRGTMCMIWTCIGMIMNRSWNKSRRNPTN